MEWREEFGTDHWPFNHPRLIALFRRKQKEAFERNKRSDKNQEYKNNEAIELDVIELFW